MVLAAIVEPIVTERGEDSNDEALPVPVTLFPSGVDVRLVPATVGNMGFPADGKVAAAAVVWKIVAVTV